MTKSNSVATLELIPIVEDDKVGGNLRGGVRSICILTAVRGFNGTHIDKTLQIGQVKQVHFIIYKLKPIKYILKLVSAIHLLAEICTHFFNYLTRLLIIGRQLKYEKEKGEAVLFGLELEKSAVLFLYTCRIFLLAPGPVSREKSVAMNTHSF